MEHCEAWDYGLLSVFLAIELFIFFVEKEIWGNNVNRVFSVAIFAWFFADYLYVAYLADTIGESVWAWVVAVVAILFVVLLGKFISIEVAAFGTFWFAATHGLAPWHWSLLFSVLIGIIAWAIAAYRKLEELGILMVDSMIMAFNITQGVLGLFAQSKAENAPWDCRTNHINMLLVCDVRCGTVLTNTDAVIPRSLWAALFLVIGAARFVFVFMHVQCQNARPKSTDNKEKKYGICTRCCFCTPKDDQFAHVDNEGDDSEKEETVSVTELTADEEEENKEAAAADGKDHDSKRHGVSEKELQELKQRFEQEEKDLEAAINGDEAKE